METKKKISFLINELERLKHETIETLHDKKEENVFYELLNNDKKNDEIIKDLTTRKNIINEILKDLENL